MVCLSSESFYLVHRQTEFATNFSSVFPSWCKDLTSLFTPYLHQIWICHCFLDNKNIVCLAVITYVKSLPYVYYIPVSYSLDRAWVNSFGSSFDMMVVITEKASINNWSEHYFNALSGHCNIWMILISSVGLSGSLHIRWKLCWSQEQWAISLCLQEKKKKKKGGKKELAC